MLLTINNFAIAIMYILMDHVFMFISFTSDEIVWLVVLYTHLNLSDHPREYVHVRAYDHALTHTSTLSLEQAFFQTMNALNHTQTHSTRSLVH